jgi:hypothetical protein
LFLRELEADRQLTAATRGAQQCHRHRRRALPGAATDWGRTALPQRGLLLMT